MMFYSALSVASNGTKNISPRQIMLFLFTLLLVDACSREIPNSVKEAFSSRFTNSKGVEWRKGPNQDWEVSFYMEKFHYMTAHFTADGILEDFEKEVHGKDIPKSMEHKIHSAYPSGIIFNVYEKNATNSIDYIFEIEDHGQLFGIDFSENGSSKIIPPNARRFTSRSQVEND